ncbi:MAG: hypothetical protein QOI80_42 [Solirubrobacteraceae bacterium]|jgi:hypothetical protein|nr:hypothetical protein [Solirubrobacteraceae bacterium]
MRTARDPITELRRAIDRLPAQTRTAMLDGIRANQIIVGAYTDDHGGICPMLAAHRNGGRTTLLAFARSWDRFAGARRVRNASRRELAVLERQLVESLEGHSEPADLRAAIADHEALKRRHEAETPDEQIEAARLTPGRVRKLRPRRGDAERALARLDLHVLAATRD